VEEGMPITTIGTKFSSPSEIVFTVRVSIEKKDGKYALSWQSGEDTIAITQRIQPFLEKTVKELNGD
jgi:hypothetical protein